MGRSVEVPVTPSVLRWAIDESGYDIDQLARGVGVPSSLLEQWVSGAVKPNLTHARKLASKLHRPFAALLLPARPEGRPLTVEFRHPIGDQRELNANERRHLRRAARFQELLSWLGRELGLEAPRTPQGVVKDDPALLANAIREVLGIPLTEQKRWATATIAFDEWRSALERAGHLVFLFSLGKDSCRGFSLWDDFAPVVAVNTAWNEPARIFTLFHEMGHLITRTSSACVESVRTSSKTDPVERWCERFAAHVLMPTRDLEAALQRYGWSANAHITDLSVASRVASRYKVSLRAAVIRLIELRAATWSLYDAIPPISDDKRNGGGGGGRNRTQIREDQFGERATSILVNAVERELLDRSQAVEFLDIPDVTFDALAQAGRAGR